MMMMPENSNSTRTLSLSANALEGPMFPRRLVLVLAVAMFGLALQTPTQAQAQADQLGLGEPFPVLLLPICGQPGQISSIMEYRGRKLMLHLFASW